jgi:hypothetical protein
MTKSTTVVDRYRKLRGGRKLMLNNGGGTKSIRAIRRNARHKAKRKARVRRRLLPKSERQQPMVGAGRGHAQREIAADWLEAYRKYVARERMEREWD